MELLLLILKIVLITFLVVLGFILLLLGVILFVPIRYEVSGELGDSWELNIKGKLTYLLSIFKLIFSYQGGQTDMQIYLFGFQKKKKTKEDSSETEANETEEEDTDAEIELRTRSDSNDSDSTVKPTVNSDTIEVEAVADTVEKKKPRTKKPTQEEKKKSKFDFAFWKAQITDEHNQYVVKKIWSELGYLLKHFKFRRIKTDLVFSTGDPASTGQILGIICMIPMLYRYEFKIVPDFEAEEAYLKGTFLVAGKVRFIHLLVTLLRLIFDKEVRLVVKRILALLDS